MVARRGSDGSASGTPGTPAEPPEDHSWLTEDDEDVPPRAERPPVKVGRARHPRVGRVRGAGRQDR